MMHFTHELSGELDRLTTPSPGGGGRKKCLIFA